MSRGSTVTRSRPSSSSSETGASPRITTTHPRKSSRGCTQRELSVQHVAVDVDLAIRRTATDLANRSPSGDLVRGRPGVVLANGPRYWSTAFRPGELSSGQAIDLSGG